MEYRDLTTLSEYDFWNITEFWQQGKSLEEIKRRMRVPISELTRILNYNHEFPLPDFTTLINEFKKTNKYLRMILTPNINYFRDIQLRPILIEGLPGYGKTTLSKYLYKLIKNYYIKQYIAKYEKRSKGLLSISGLITNDFNYLYRNFPQADICYTVVDDADREHDSARSLSPENVLAISNFWNIRHVQEELYNQEIGLLTNVFNTHLHIALLKRFRTAAKYIFYKNTFTDKDENWDLRKKIKKYAFLFLQAISHWLDISPIFAKFFILQSGEKIFFGKTPLVNVRIKEIIIDKEAPESKEQELAEILGIRLLGAGNGQNKYSYRYIKELMKLPKNEKTISADIMKYLKKLIIKYNLT